MKRINVPHGAISVLVSELGFSRNTIAKALSGGFDEFSICYGNCMKIREYAKTRFSK